MMWIYIYILSSINHNDNNNSAINKHDVAITTEINMIATTIGAGINMITMRIVIIMIMTRMIKLIMIIMIMIFKT